MCKMFREYSIRAGLRLPALACAVLSFGGLLAAPEGRAQVLPATGVTTTIMFQTGFAPATGNFQFTSGSRIVLTAADQDLINLLDAPRGWLSKLRHATGLDLQVTVSSTHTANDIVLSNSPSADFIALTTSAEFTIRGRIRHWGQRTPKVLSKSIGKSVKEEGYRYTTGAAGAVTVQFAEDMGALRAIQSLTQLVMQDGNAAGAHRALPRGTGIDYPAYEVRRINLDVASHFISADVVIGIMEKMSMHKLNELGLQLNSDATDSRSRARGYFRLRLYGDDDFSRQGNLTPDFEYYSKDDWDRMEDAAARYGIKLVPVINMYENAIAWREDTVAGKPDTRATASSQRRTAVRRVDISDAAKRTKAAKYFTDLLGMYAHASDSARQWFRSDTIVIGGGPDDGVPGYMLTLRSSITVAYSQFTDVQMEHWSKNGSRGARLAPLVSAGARDFVHIRKDPNQGSGADHSASGVNWPSDSFIEGNRYWLNFNAKRPAGNIIDGTGYPRGRDVPDPEIYHDYFWEMAGRWLSSDIIPKGIETSLFNTHIRRTIAGQNAQDAFINAFVAAGIPGPGLIGWYSMRPLDPAANFSDGARANQPFYDNLNYDNLIPVSQELSSYWIGERYPYLNLSGAEALAMLHAVSEHQAIRKRVDSSFFEVGGANVGTTGGTFWEAQTPGYFGGGGDNNGSDHGSGVLSTATNAATRRARDWMAWNTEEMNEAFSGPMSFPSGMFVVDMAGEGNMTAAGRVCEDLNAEANGGSSVCDLDFWFNAISGAGGLQKKGPGSLFLFGTNTFTGGVELEGGTLSIEGNANLGAASSTLSFAGGTLQLSRGFRAPPPHLPASRNIEVASGSFASFNVDGTNATISGNITGAGGLEKSGDGILFLAGTGSDYSGDTRVLAGGLTVSGQGIPAGGDLYAAISTTVNFSNASGQNTLGDVTGDGTFIKSGDGDLLLSGGTASWSIFNGKLASSGDFDGNLMFENGSGSVAAAFVFRKDGNQRYAGVLSGSSGGEVFKEGSGALVLTGDSGSCVGCTFEIDGGTTVYVDGVFGDSTSSASVDGVLGGKGRMGGDVEVESGGALMGGRAGGGRLTIGGDLTLKSGSEYRWHINGHVTVGGDADIESGSSVLMLNLLSGSIGGAVGSLHTFTILTVGGTVTGEFADHTTATDFAFMTVAIVYTNTGLQVNLERIG